jgi:prepilin-type N-terminal cleavage/methylation domain-containing protein
MNHHTGQEPQPQGRPKSGRRTPQFFGAPAARGAGFTLIEVICVIVILGLLATAISSRSTSMGVILPTRVEEVRSALRAMQLRAIKENNVEWGVSASAAAYWAFNGTDPSITTAQIPLPSESSKQVSLAAKGMTVTPFTWYFDRYGVPYNASGKLTAPDTITITADGQSQTLTLTPITGYIP